MDLKHPTGPLAHPTLVMLFHGRMSHGAHGVEDLPAIVSAAGFTDVRSGMMGLRSLGLSPPAVPADGTHDRGCADRVPAPRLLHEP